MRRRRHAQSISSLPQVPLELPTSDASAIHLVNSTMRRRVVDIKFHIKFCWHRFKGGGFTTAATGRDGSFLPVSVMKGREGGRRAL